MKAELNRLIKHCGSKKAAAKALGITDRTIRGLLNSTKEKPYPCGKSLRILINHLINDIKIRDLIK
jgi:hypothetical protein